MTTPPEAPLEDLSEEQERLPTAPDSIQMSMRCFESEQQAKEFADILAAHIRSLSRYIDLSNLDGVTVASDYHLALRELDRGYQASRELEASTEHVEGIAMTPSVMRDGQLKSHIVFNAVYILPLADFDHEHYAHSLHTLAHECAHVRITQAFDLAFPNVLLRASFDNLYECQRSDVMLGCWDEYAATLIAARIGRDPTADYEKCFIEALERTRRLSNEKIIEYRVHGDHARIINETYYLYATLMKLACYHLGNMAGRGLKVSDLSLTQQALEGSWFAGHWVKLEEACRAIWDRFGEWEDMSLFDAIADIADGVLASGGVFIRKNGDRVRVDIPFTLETMPSAA